MSTQEGALQSMWSVQKILSGIERRSSTPGPLMGRDRQHPITGVYPDLCQTGQAGAPGPNSVLLRELDILMYHHKTSCIRSMGTDRVTYSQTYPPLEGGPGGDSGTQRLYLTGSPVGGPDAPPISGCLPTDSRHKYSRAAVSTALCRQQDRYVGSGMVKHPISMIRYRSPRSPNKLWRLRGGLLNITCPRF